MIKRVGGGAVLGAAVVVGAWLAWPRSPASGRQAEPIQAPQRGETAKFFGVASCASMACHHFNGAKAEARSEYSTWSAWDKHARAYAVLENDRSRRIVRNLYYSEADPDKVPATARRLCLECHSTYAAKGEAGERFFVGDGVGCESCHGPAEKYLTTHYARGFKEKSNEEKESVYGLRNVWDLSKRTKLCTSCHVGNATKEVNHDLIAAGHPRLNFEMGGYHGIYNKHWNDRNYTTNPAKNQPVDFEARLWLLGQLTAAKASLELLESRAANANKSIDKPWPEFSEYACYACHKNLELLDSREVERQTAKYKTRPVGAPAYGTWYLSLVTPLSKKLGGETASALPGDLAKLRGIMEKPAPNAQAAAREAGAAARRLDQLIARVAKEPALDPKQLRGYIELFAQDGADRAKGMDWDDATQVYLSLAAFQTALSDSGKADPGVKNDLLAIKKRLRSAFPPGVDSPQYFNPVAEPTLASQLDTIRRHLGK
ncbi:MAG: hypothetical protein HYS12_19725 [Planctomycetes bacterium]|nr:hypothetical protein [Planctomycetota bacterium]